MAGKSRLGRACEGCGAALSVNRPLKTRYCTPECRTYWTWRRGRSRIPRCPQCRRRFATTDSRQRYCTPRCANRAAYLRHDHITDPARREKRKAIVARYQARLAAAPGTATTEQIAARVSMFGGRCYVCGALYEQIDHVIPLSRNGSNWPANLRPICAGCNRQKGGRIITAAQLRAEISIGRQRRRLRDAA